LGYRGALLDILRFGHELIHVDQFFQLDRAFPTMRLNVTLARFACLAATVTVVACAGAPESKHAACLLISEISGNPPFLDLESNEQAADAIRELRKVAPPELLTEVEALAPIDAEMSSVYADLMATTDSQPFLGADGELDYSKLEAIQADPQFADLARQRLQIVAALVQWKDDHC
jgi:hypothetical protein